MTHTQEPAPKSVFNFSYGELREFLAFIGTKAEVGPMRDANRAKGNYIILRQDIDLDFYPSYEVMKIQRGLGISSTFFILNSSPTYNPQTARIRGMLREMSAMSRMNEHIIGTYTKLFTNRYLHFTAECR